MKILSRKNEKGFTLIEIMVVVAIIAIMMGLVAGVAGVSTQAKLKSESNHVMGMIRYAYNEAITSNRAYRVVFDLTDQQYWAEVASDNFVLELEDSKKNEKKDEKKPEGKKEKSLFDDEPDPDADEDAVEETTFSADEDVSVKKRKIDSDDIKIKDIAVDYQKGSLSSGKVYLYFFPAGRTQMAVIHVSSADEGMVYSIIVNPITGKCKVEYEEVNLEEDQQ